MSGEGELIQEWKRLKLREKDDRERVLARLRGAARPLKWEELEALCGIDRDRALDAIESATEAGYPVAFGFWLEETQKTENDQ